jgi:hypothetical protein
LRFVADDYLGELRAQVRYCNEWLAQRPDLAAGTNGLRKPGDRVLGSTAFEWRGLKLETAVMPYRIYLLQRIQAAATAAPALERAAIDSLLARTGLSELLSLKTTRRVERHNNLEIWGDVIP